MSLFRFDTLILGVVVAGVIIAGIYLFMLAVPKNDDERPHDGIGEPRHAMTNMLRRLAQLRRSCGASGRSERLGGTVEQTQTMASPESDPRVFFASERTLLAWVRTGLAIIGLGYVVARFGLFLRIMAHEVGQAATISQNPISRVIGVAFVAVGAVSVVMAAVQHRTFIKGLPAKDLPTNYYRAFALWVAISISLLGLALAAYLVMVRP